MMGLCQPYTLTIAFLNGKDKDIKRFQELIKLVPIKTGIKRRCLNMLKDLKKTDLLQDVYGMSDVEKLLFIDIKKLEYIARRRGKKIRELIKRGRCQAVSLTEIMDYLTGDIYGVTDVLLRYFGEKFGEPTNMAKEIESYKEDYLSRYSVRVNVAAKQIKELKECIESDNGVSCYAQQLEEKLRTLEFYINSLTDNLEGLLLFSPDNGKGIGREAKKLRSELRSLKKDLKGLILKGENIESVKSHLMELTRYLERANERLSLINSTLKIEEEERGKISYVV
jgi:hypothetical protein